VRCRSVRLVPVPWGPGCGPGVFLLSLMAANLARARTIIKHVFDRVAQAAAWGIG
jgi:hypothetical protein